jgi:hypothetical protein
MISAMQGSQFRLKPSARAIVCVLVLLGAPTSLLPVRTVAFCSTVQSVRGHSQNPEIDTAIRTLIYAIYSRDVASFQKCIVPEARSNDLIETVKRLSPVELKKLRAEVDAMEFRQLSPFTNDGQEVRPRYPLGTKTTYMSQFRGTLLVIPVVYTQSGWKVDVRFWLEARREAEEASQSGDQADRPPDKPELIAKGFLFCILARRTEDLGELSASPINAEEYTAANDLPGGDLDQVLSLCIEMPVVRARTGEAFKMPSGRIVRADRKPDTLVLVGMMGMVEVAFELKLIGGKWKVVPERYFEMLRRIGAI